MKQKLNELSSTNNRSKYYSRKSWVDSQNFLTSFWLTSLSLRNSTTLRGAAFGFFGCFILGSGSFLIKNAAINMAIDRGRTELIWSWYFESIKTWDQIQFKNRRKEKRGQNWNQGLPGENPGRRPVIILSLIKFVTKTYILCPLEHLRRI